MTASLSSACTPATFCLPAVFGAEIYSLTALVVSNYSTSVPEAYRFTQPSVEVRNATFCNVTVSYTHPGQNDSIIVEAWLPIDGWNGRFQAVGGGGWVAGRFFLSYNAMSGAIADGYATITTDAGLGNATDARPWALLSPGNVNLYSLQNLMYRSLNDEAIIGKSLIKSFYGKGPDFSYWNGCSQGGRQGMMLAQRYPTAYDGIAAGAPAIYWNGLFSSVQWPQQVMNMLGSYPYGCEIDAISFAAISACDMLDGVVDGVISDPAACLAIFDPFDLVGTTINCSQAGGDIRISPAAAVVANATWHGPLTENGKQIWYGLSPGTDLTGNSLAGNSQPGLAAMNCRSGVCVGAPSYLGLQWLELFIAKDPSFNSSNLTYAEFDRLVHAGEQEFGAMVNTDDPDLAAFRDAGGKMVSFHGLDDNIIPPKGSEQYYNAVAASLPDVHDFYRHYQIPGLAHCWGGPSAAPTSLFAQLRAWVENGTVPEQSPVKLKGPDGAVQNRIICPYPQIGRFSRSCGEVADEKCWSCTSTSFSKKGLQPGDDL